SAMTTPGAARSRGRRRVGCGATGGTDRQARRRSAPSRRCATALPAVRAPVHLRHGPEALGAREGRRSMPTRRPRSRLRHALLIAVALATVLAACSNSSDKKTTATGSSGSTANTTQSVAISGVPGVTDTEIRYSSLGTNSNNPLGTCVLQCFDDGVKAYFDFRNSQGGIYGRHLVLSKEVDDALANNQAKALEIISANDTFGTFSAAQIAS